MPVNWIGERLVVLELMLVAGAADSRFAPSAEAAVGHDEQGCNGVVTTVDGEPKPGLWKVRILPATGKKSNCWAVWPPCPAVKILLCAPTVRRTEAGREPARLIPNN